MKLPCVPAKAGTQSYTACALSLTLWVPAFAGTHILFDPAALPDEATARRWFQ
jgi:hypothetical protein